MPVLKDRKTKDELREAAALRKRRELAWKDDQVAYGRGQAAGHRGWGLEANPYETGKSKCAAKWRQGWESVTSR